MNIRKLVFAALLATAGVGSAQAQELAPARAHQIALGDVDGVAYYTNEGGSFHVVATLAQQDGQPVRFETVLVPGQSIVLSTAVERGSSAPARVEISRKADELLVQAVPVTN